MEYNLSLDELMMVAALEKEPRGFMKEELQEVEQRIGVSLPKSYKDYMTKWGKVGVNSVHNRLEEPSEIMTSYEMIEEDMEDWGFEELSKEELQEKAENPYYQLAQLPKEKWNTITENYVIIAWENQGVWMAGYLLKDLKDGISNPPIYMTTNDDEISFQRIYDSIEKFIMGEMIRHSFFGYTTTDSEEIDKILEEEHIEKEKLMQPIDLLSEKEDYLGSCVDREKRCLYYYLKFPWGDEELTIEEYETR